MTVEWAALIAAILFFCFYKNYKIAAYMILASLFGFLYIVFAGYYGEFPVDKAVTGLGSDSLALLEVSRFFFWSGIVVFCVYFILRVRRGIQELENKEKDK